MAFSRTSRDRKGAHWQKVWEADWRDAYRALQDARLYVTDFDRTGQKAERIYERLDGEVRRMREWSSDGPPSEAKRATEWLREAFSILTYKIGPASRATLPGQKNARDRLHRRDKTRKYVVPLEDGDEFFVTLARAKARAQSVADRTRRTQEIYEVNPDPTKSDKLRALVRPRT